MSNDRKQRAEQMRKEREKAEKRQRNVISVAIVAVVVALVAVGGYAIKTTSDRNAKNTELVAPQGATEDYSIVYSPEAAAAAEDADAPAEGDASEDEAAAGDPVEVELYEDFQCPACRSFEEQTGAFLKQMVQAGEITIVYRPFSFLDSMSTNEYSSRSTNAALCALDQGDVNDYVAAHDYLYQNQPAEGGAGPENPALIAGLESVGITGIESCIRTERFVPWIEEAASAGRDAGVSATPTVLVAGEKLENASAQALQAAIDEAKAS